jgi:hypothetical protein
MKNANIVVALALSRREAICRANVPTPLTKRPKPQHCLKRKNAWAAFWSSVFVFFVEGYVMYGASMHPAATAVAVVLVAAKLPEPRSARRTPIAAAQEHSSSLISGDSNVVAIPPSADPGTAKSPESGELLKEST